MRESFEGDVLVGALRATFARRRTALPVEVPIALTLAFADVEGKRAQWVGFVRRNRLTSAPAALESVIDGVASFIGPALAAAARDERLTETWRPGGPWKAGSRIE
jgi:hypothetical protein